MSFAVTGLISLTYFLSQFKCYGILFSIIPILLKWVLPIFHICATDAYAKLATNTNYRKTNFHQIRIVQENYETAIWPTIASLKHQAIPLTNADLFSLEANFTEIWIKIQ